MNEVGLNASWIRKDMTHSETQEFTKKVLNHMRNRLSDYQEKYGDLYNLEATPAESTTYRLAKNDKKLYPDIITAAKEGETPYYTNSSHLPVWYTEDIFDALEIQDELQTLYTSGTVFHAFLGEKLPDWKAAANLVRKIAENFRLPYYTMSPTYSVCREHGYLVGEQYTCPHCGSKTEVYSRITGYYRPIQNWNDGKSQEYKDRKEYNIPLSLNKYSEKVKEMEEVKDEAKEALLKDGLYLFTTATCPNCRMAKTFLAQARIEYKEVSATENVELTKSLGVQSAPTLVEVKNGEANLIENVSNIRRYIETVKA